MAGFGRCTRSSVATSSRFSGCTFDRDPLARRQSDGGALEVDVAPAQAYGSDARNPSWYASRIIAWLHAPWRLFLAGAEKRCHFVAGEVGAKALCRNHDSAVTGWAAEPTCLYFTNVVKYGEDARLYEARSMKAKKGKKMQTENAVAVRATISFPPQVYQTLEVIAKEKKVSLAWVVREAAERYIAERWPLLQERGQ